MPFSGAPRTALFPSSDHPRNSIQHRKKNLPSYLTKSIATMKMMKALALGLLVLAFAVATVLGCSRGSPYGGNECCREYGYCGTGGSYCGPGCQSGPCYGKGAILNENGVPANAC